jgi:membrane peptidoglycan carboxypeptidase
VSIAAREDRGGLAGQFGRIQRSYVDTAPMTRVTERRGTDRLDALAPSSGGPPGRRRAHAGHRTKPRSRRKLVHRILFGTLLTGLLCAVLGVVAFMIAYAQTELPDAGNQTATSNTTTVYFGDGKTVMGQYFSENRKDISLDQVPKHVQDAVIAAENRTFWTDSGFSLTGMARAAWNMLRGKPTQGGSTITQQYVKNFYLKQDQTLTRKIKELFIALKVEREYSKEEILQSYLNTSYFGHGAYGIEVAAKVYFGKHTHQLTPYEAALLAVQLKGPSLYDPDDPDDRTRLEQRYRYVLDGMAQLGADGIDPAKIDSVPLPKTKPYSPKTFVRGPNGFLLMQVRKELQAMGYSDRDIETGGLTVYTTIDPKAQRALVRAVKRYFPTKNAKGVYAGAAAVRPGSGEVVALYGGRDYLKRQFNDATQAKLQPGSTFKAFALAAALEKGIALESRYAGNSPFELPDGDQVRNEHNQDYGKYVTLLEATAESINTAYVDLTVNDLGPDAVVDAALRAGIPRNTPGLDRHAKVSLGFASVSPIDMANAYATFAVGGQRAKWHLVKSVEGRDGGVEREVRYASEQAFDPDVVRDVNYALQEVVENGTGEREAKAIGRPAAGKTGTHEDETAWFVGYTPQLSAAVAFYKDANGDGKKESLDNVGGLNTFFGGSYPAKIWAAFMKAALKGQPVIPFPPPAHIGKAVNPEPVVELSPTPTPEATEPPPPIDEGFPERPRGPKPKPSDPEIPPPPDDGWPWDFGRGRD